MAQVNSNQDLAPSTRILRAENLAVSVVQTGNTTLLELFVERIEKIVVQLAASVQALDAFVVQTQAHPGAAYVTRASVAADFTSPSGRILAASGDLTTLSAATGWFEMDVSGLFAVKILASGGNATPSVVSIYATGTGAGQSASSGINQTTPGVTNNTSSVAPANQATGQVATSTGAATLVAARATRKSVTIRNVDTVISVYIGPATVSAANGMLLKAGESISVDTTALIQVIAASGTPTVAYYETYY